MRWWLNTDAPGIFSVDNAAATGMDFSALDPDIWMVQWTDGKGEIERQTADGKNLNGLREQFIDVIPYAPLFQQFLTRMQDKALLLAQAKKVDVDLIRQIFESKRQAPFHYPVAAGDYWWDATDETLFASTAAQLQNAIASINAIVTRLNSVIPGLNAIDGSIVTQVNSEINSKVVASGDALTTAHNSTLTAITNGIYIPLYYFVDHFNAVLGTHIDYDNLGLNTINNRLQRRTDYPLDGEPAPGPTGAGLPGLAATLPTYANSVGGPGSATGPDFPNIAVSYGGGVAWTPLPSVSSANAQWIPVGGTAPVNVTPPEQTAIMNGIAARTNDLNVKKNTKIGQVNALTTVAAVIAYDVTTGW